ncbi:MAG: hypothetical protein U0640_10730 [Phycisphaerales bacterium]
MRIKSFSPRLVAGFVVASALCAASPVAFAQDVISEFNKKAYGDIQQSKRSDLVLLPVLAKTQTPPASVSSVFESRMLLKGMKGWDQAAAWATAAPQVEALKALKTVSSEWDWRKSYQFGLPYGYEGVSPELIRANLYINISDPPTLAAAEYSYLPALDRLEMLANIEASRLYADNKPNEAIDIMLSFAHLSRQMCSRKMIREATWGLDAFCRSMERIRDIGYRSLVDKKQFDIAALSKQIETLHPDGYFAFKRMEMPEGDSIAATQALARVTEGTQFNTQQFGSLMAKMSTAGKPLRLFSEAATWKDATSSHLTPKETETKIANIYADWKVQWGLDPFDGRLGNKTPYEELNPEKSILITKAIPDIRPLRAGRQVAQAEIVGARTALSILGVFQSNNMFPNQITAIRPRFVKELDADPFDPKLRETTAKPPMRFLEIKAPQEVLIATSSSSGPENFSISLKPGVFLLYSIGSDNKDNKATRIENTSQIVQGADYLIFPPVLSLFRQHRVDTGELE